MLKKLFITAAAAAAVSVPLAGVAWAEPDSNSPPGQNDTGPGLPAKLGTFADTGIKGKILGTPSLNPSGAPTPPGSVFVKPLTGLPGNIPGALGDFENQLWSAYTLADGTSIPTTWGDTPPGLAIKPLTPGCNGADCSTRSTRLGPGELRRRLTKTIRAARIPLLGCGWCPVKGLVEVVAASPKTPVEAAG